METVTDLIGKTQYVSIEVAKDQEERIVKLEEYITKLEEIGNKHEERRIRAIEDWEKVLLEISYLSDRVKSLETPLGSQLGSKLGPFQGGLQGSSWTTTHSI